ncbi:MAG: hypothetical protein IH987_09515, partial [Planctomycetes bacterium]|nr:hypothetical protein [Planctomycetota bacterium]
MGESYRRLISTPADISTADTTALAERLAQNVQLQRELAAQSPHVLQFTSDLQTDEGGFYIEHEPAIVPGIPIFSPDAAVAEEEDLLRWAIALADSLRAAHSHSKRIVHGGLCPGVILTTPEGVQKITDFGFAPSICAALGVESFVNLCVENRARDSGDVKETGVWHIISPDVEHDDRICGFVDPQKYGNQTLHTFEPVSDIIGAGFLLHIMAENRHPYLHDNQDLRLPELAEAMAFFFYDGSRRKSLLDSSDERIKVWRDIVAKMLEHLPDDRPNAATITTRLVEVGVEPHSLGDAQMRELDALAVFIGEEKYEDARDRARALAGGAATEEITELAMSLLRSAEAGLRLAKASEILDTVDWRKARDELNAIDRNGLRAELVKKAEAVESALKALTEIDDRMTALESSFEQIASEKPTTGEEAKRLHSELDTLLGELTKLAAEIELPASFLGRSDTLRADLDARLEAVQQTISTIDAHHSAARRWLAELQKAEKDEPRERVRDLLAGRTDLSIAHWPEEVIAAANATAKRIEEISQAESWMARLTAAVQEAETDDARLEAAQSCLAEKPRITDWPQKLREDSDSLARRLGEVESKSADRAKAAQWLERILQAVAGEDWATANRELTAKPSLRHWTDDAVAEEARLKPLIEAQLEEQERIEVWLQSAKGAGDAEDFATALGILDSPPVPKEKIPKSAKKQINKWRKEFETKLADARDRALKQRSEAIRDKARNLVGQVVRDDFSKFLLAESIETTVETVEWDSDDAASAGHGSFAVHVQFQGRNEAAPSIHEDLQFQLNEGLPQILNDQSLRDRLGAELRRIVHQHQTHTAMRLAEPLRQGLFPEATVETAIAEMSERTSAKVSFLDSKAGVPAMETVVVWDAKRADWAYADPESVVQRAVDIAASVSRELLKPKLLESSNLLRQYSSVLQTDATAPPPPSPPVIPRSLTLEGRLTIHLDDDDSAPLMTFPVSCPRAGEVTVAVDLRPAEAKLSEFVVARQRAAQASVIKQLEGRLTGANVRCKLTPLVKRIKKPVDEVGFLLKPKRGDKVTVTANWNRDRFLFELGEQAETELKAVLNGAPAAVDPATRKVDSAKEVTTSNGKRPAVAVVGVVIFVA